jgi:prevent-host-death family protein
MAKPAVVMVGVRDLKNRLTAYLRLARRDHEVIVTERGEPIAIIRSLESARTPKALEAKIAALAARGLVTAPARRLVKRVQRIKISGPPLSRVVVEDRR